MDTSPIPVEALLAHREWVRSVARAVVRDPNAGDDVEQDAWFEALHAPPQQASSLRGWFGAVVRNRARRMGRTTKRRTARETAAARPEATQSAADLAEIADTHRRVVQAVVELDEPYRETILLRYFEGLAVDVVAARTNAPLNTARARISRGLAKLRERLAEELGEDDRPWQMVLVPLIGKSHGTGLGAAAAGGGVMLSSTVQWGLAAAAAMALTGVAVVVAIAAKDPPPAAMVVASAPVAPPPPPVAGQEKPAPRPPRQHAADPAPPAPKPEDPKPKPPEETVLQRLQKTKMTAEWREAPFTAVVAELAARSNVEIVIAQEAMDALGKDAALESLTLDQEVGANQLLDLVTQLKGVHWTIEEPRVVIVSADGLRDTSLPVIVPPKWTPPGPVEVTGRVTDQSGAPVAGAQIMQLHADAKSVGTTDVGGRYDIHLDWPYGSLEARMDGHVRSFAASVSGRNGAAQKMDFALRGAAGSLSVRALSDAGPLPGVVVSIDADVDAVTLDVPAAKKDERPATQSRLSATTDERGYAVFPGVPPGRASVVGDLDGYEPARGTVGVTVGSRSELELRLVAKVDLKTKLDKEHISFNFSGATADQVVKFINDAKQLSIVVDPAIAPRVQSAEINLELKDVPVAQALRSLCEQIGGVTYRLQDPVIWIHASDR